MSVIFYWYSLLSWVGWGGENSWILYYFLKVSLHYADHLNALESKLDDIAPSKILISKTIISLCSCLADLSKLIKWCLWESEILNCLCLGPACIVYLRIAGTKLIPQYLAENRRWGAQAVNHGVAKSFITNILSLLYFLSLSCVGEGINLPMFSAWEESRDASLVGCSLWVT